MNAYYATRLSENMGESPEGFRVCTSVPLCRSGWQTYRAEELGLGSADEVRVYRSPDEILSRTFLASLEGRTITSPHPPIMLTPANASGYSRGHAQNIGEGTPLPNGDRVVVGDLWITDGFLIDQIDQGLREVSVGYSCSYSDRGDGTFEQRDLRANHIAIVPNGRAGSKIRINDSKPEGDNVDNDTKRLMETLERLVAILEARETTTDTRTEPFSFKKRSEPLANRLIAECNDLQKVLGRNPSPVELNDWFLRSVHDARQAADDGADYAAKMKAAGREMQQRFIPAACRPSLLRRTEDAVEDWGAAQNRRGRELRSAKR